MYCTVQSYVLKIIIFLKGMAATATVEENLEHDLKTTIIRTIDILHSLLLNDITDKESSRNSQ